MNDYRLPVMDRMGKIRDIYGYIDAIKYYDANNEIVNYYFFMPNGEIIICGKDPCVYDNWLEVVLKRRYPFHFTLKSTIERNDRRFEEDEIIIKECRGSRGAVALTNKGRAYTVGDGYPSIFSKEESDYNDLQNIFEATDLHGSVFGIKKTGEIVWLNLRGYIGATVSYSYKEPRFLERVEEIINPGNRTSILEEYKREIEGEDNSQFLAQCLPEVNFAGYRMLNMDPAAIIGWKHDGEFMCYSVNDVRMCKRDNIGFPLKNVVKGVVTAEDGKQFEDQYRHACNMYPGWWKSGLTEIFVDSEVVDVLPKPCFGGWERKVYDRDRVLITKNGSGYRYNQDKERYELLHTGIRYGFDTRNYRAYLFDSGKLVLESHKKEFYGKSVENVKDAYFGDNRVIYVLADGSAGYFGFNTARCCTGLNKLHDIVNVEIKETSTTVTLRDGTVKILGKHT